MGTSSSGSRVRPQLKQAHLSSPWVRWRWLLIEHKGVTLITIQLQEVKVALGLIFSKRFNWPELVAAVTADPTPYFHLEVVLTQTSGGNSDHIIGPRCENQALPPLMKDFQNHRFFFTNDSVSCSQTGRTHEPDGGVEAPASVHEFQINLRRITDTP